MVALNGWVNAGTNGGYPVGMIEEALYANFDITCAASLAGVSPSWTQLAVLHRRIRCPARLSDLNVDDTVIPRESSGFVMPKLS